MQGSSQKDKEGTRERHSLQGERVSTFIESTIFYVSSYQIPNPSQIPREIGDGVPTSR